MERLVLINDVNQSGRVPPCRGYSAESRNRTSLAKGVGFTDRPASQRQTRQWRAGLFPGLAANRSTAHGTRCRNRTHSRSFGGCCVAITYRMWFSGRTVAVVTDGLAPAVARLRPHPLVGDPCGPSVQSCSCQSAAAPRESWGRSLFVLSSAPWSLSLQKPMKRAFTLEALDSNQDVAGCQLLFPLASLLPAARASSGVGSVSPKIGWDAPNTSLTAMRVSKS